MVLSCGFYYLSLGILIWLLEAIKCSDVDTEITSKALHSMNQEIWRLNGFLLSTCGRVFSWGAKKCALGRAVDEVDLEDDAEIFKFSSK